MRRPIISLIAVAAAASACAACSIDAPIRQPPPDLATPGGKPDISMPPAPDLAESDADNAVPFGEPCGELAGSIFIPGFQASGSVSFIRPKPNVAGVQQRVSISAPIFPKTSVLYAGEGGNYPQNQPDREKLAHDSALTFCFLLTDCQPNYPTIKTTPPLTPAELSNNYEQVADCSYQKYTAKPYWIPQLVSDVDICKSEIGAGWRLITEEDLGQLSNNDAKFITQTLTTGGGGFGGFYFSVRVFARAATGEIVQGDMGENVFPRTTPFPKGTDPHLHYEGALALRCIKLADI